MDSGMGQDWVYGWALGLPYPSLYFGTRDKESPIKFTNPGLSGLSVSSRHSMSLKKQPILGSDPKSEAQPLRWLKRSSKHKPSRDPIYLNTPITFYWARDPLSDHKASSCMGLHIPTSEKQFVFVAFMYFKAISLLMGLGSRGPIYPNTTTSSL
ncbi:hypothetical protein NC653_023336 [Populus alba x Populus x berolinensis]|uniref:Uncharacterized protein n=1 Tax=Populus alba x Populus x berolinensis TaxID=444605 RepID=A0AAD6MH06_9ROSI|nr:hypothetical protein NC653_023336 [Populus alba x Populus x berolinensis]